VYFHSVPAIKYRIPGAGNLPFARIFAFGTNPILCCIDFISLNHGFQGSEADWLILAIFNYINHGLTGLKLFIFHAIHIQ
jgi:hypothetical protein